MLSNKDQDEPDPKIFSNLHSVANESSYLMNFSSIRTQRTEQFNKTELQEDPKKNLRNSPENSSVKFIIYPDDTLKGLWDAMSIL